MQSPAQLPQKGFRHRIRNAWRLGAPLGRHVGRMRVRDRLKATIAAVGAVGIIATGAVAIVSTSAQAAAVEGAGGAWTPSGGWLGNYIATDGSGKRIYCIDVQADSIGSGGPGSVSSSISATSGTRTVSGDELKKLNYAISTWGQTGDANQAAAVSAYVYNFTSSNNYGNGQFYIDGGDDAAITSIYWQIAADTEVNYNQGGGGAGTGYLDFQVDGTNNYEGNMVAHVDPANATGTVSLANGVFADTGLATKDGIVNNGVYPVHGVAPEDGSDYKISGEGAFTGSGGTAYSSNVTIYSDELQRTAGPGTTTTSPVSFTINGADPTFRIPDFNPVVGTQVSSKFVEVGQEFTDTLNFATTADDAGLNNPWYVNRSGRYAPITAVGTLYGPSLSPFTESDDAPAGVPVVASGVTVTTTPEAGPTIAYAASSGVTSDEAGYYTWVWEIKYDDQIANVQNFLTDGYYFKDRFGQVNETHVTPTKLDISTEVTETEVAIGDPITDNVTVSLKDGGWLSDGNGRIPVTLTGTAYYTATEPVTAASAPADTEVIGTTSLTVNRQGTKESDPLTVPIREGYVTFQWCIMEANQPEQYRGMIAEKCDFWGVPSETAKIVAPEVTTQAKTLATVHDPINDTAIIDGKVPDNTVVEFELYKKIVAGDAKYDAEGNKTDAIWTQEEIDALGDQAVCEVTNRVTKTERVDVAPGSNDNAEYDSPKVWVDENGVYWWVESLIHVNPETGEETIIHRGECGLPNETTTIEEPKVTTKATPEVELGQEARDTATVTGPIPGKDSGIRTEITFEAFKKVGSAPTCTPDNRVFNLDTPVVITEAGEPQSAPVKFADVGTYYWVETLTYVDIETGKKQVIHVGECGLPDETTVVKAVPAGLASTGFSGMPMLITGGVLLLGGALVMSFVMIRRRQANRVES